MRNPIPTQHRPSPDRPAARQGQTQPAQGPAQQPVPRMPHERDESADSQAADEPSAKRMGRLAHEDIERGVVDTGTGPPLGEAYDKLRRDTPDGGKKFRP